MRRTWNFPALFAIPSLGLIGVPALAAATDGTGENVSAKWNVAIVIHEGVELLDFAGPGEVFECAARRDSIDSTPWFNVYTVAPRAEQIVSQRFLTIVPEFSIEDAPAPDILVIPGGETGSLRRDEAFMSWVESSLPDAQIALSVCTGAFVLADLGVLDGKEITTHWSALDGLRRATTNTVVRDDVRFIDNEAIVTTAGVSAGIDGSLHVVARLLGYEHARQTARYMQYEWNPTEEHISSYSKLNPQLDQLNRDLQEAKAMREAGRIDESVAAYHQVTSDYPKSGEAWYYLGLLLHAEGDLDAALSAHLKAVECGSERFKINGLYNAACVHSLQERPDEALAFLERCAEAGSINARWTLRDDDLASIREQPRFRTAVARMWINEARVLMERNLDDRAIDALTEAQDLGFDDFASILADPDFQRLRTSKAFAELQENRSPG